MVVNRLHKIIKFPLIQKYYLIFVFLIGFGYYKNGFVPYLNNYNTFGQMLYVFILPIGCFLLGSLFDVFFKNKDLFNSKFYSLLFIMLIPLQSNFFLVLGILVLLLSIYNFLSLKKIDNKTNIIVLAKLLLVFFLILFKSYDYQNRLEISGLFQYSLLDSLIGYNVGCCYSTSVLILILGVIILLFDEYYKKEIPLYSYGFYLLTLFLYAFFKQDMKIILVNMFSSSILFGIIFVGTLSNFTPCTKKKKFLYSLILGFSILPFSLLVNFNEGVYISIVLANFILNLGDLVFKNSRVLLKKGKVGN